MEEKRTPNIIDIGVNLFCRNFNSGRNKIVQSAKDARVFPIIIIGSTLENVRQASNFCENTDGVYFTCGIHPHNAKNEQIEKVEEMIRKYANHSKCVAIGETGLDYEPMFSTRVAQLTMFERHIRLAIELNKPLFLHERDAHGHFMQTLKQFSKLPPVVVHCFVGSESELDRYVQCGFYIGISGFVCMSPRGDSLRRFVSKIPLDKLLIETDSPYMSPSKELRNNEPQYLWHVVRALAECYSIPENDLALITRENTIKFFKLYF